MSGAPVPLVLACWDYDRTRALMDGRVRPEGIDLTYLPVGIPESFFRMLRDGEFDVSEMSMAWYIPTLFSEPRPFVAIPVFPSRVFRHSSIYVHAASGIHEPKDLVGARVGCPEYAMTAAVWIRGILAEHYDVPVASVTYCIGGFGSGPREMPVGLPEEIRVEAIPGDRTLSQMLESGEIDALYTAQPPEAFERRSPNVRRLFDDHAAVERDFFARTRVFPIMHTVVIRREVHDRHPWVAQSLTDAFERAKALAYDELGEMTALKYTLPWLASNVEEARQAMGDDFWPYGLQRNRETLATFLRYMHEQGLSPRRLEPEELFVPETLETA